MPQGLGKNLYPTLSVFENIDFFGRLFGHGRAERERRIAELLESTGLAPFADRPAGKLSGGMKQKLGLCCALIHDPDLLILDEPTTGVDPLSRRQFWELIARIRADRPGMSVLVATAYMEEAARFDWLVAMDAGRVLATGTPAELLAQTGTALARGGLHRPAAGGEAPRPPAGGDPAARRPGDDEVAIEAHDLTMRFGDFIAVDHVSFRIERGEIFGFLGSNGCGKTTTMKMLTGLLPASEGQAWLFGQPVDAQRPRDPPPGRLHVAGLLALYRADGAAEPGAARTAVPGARPRRSPARVEEMAQRFDLAAIMDALPGALPLGQRQRLSLAVAMIHRPEMLILDEPTSGVDPVARDGFWQILIDLSRRDKVTIFISTHFMNEAERCDRISLMHAGRVLVSDAPAALVEKRGAATLEDAFIGYLEDAAEGPGPTRRRRRRAARRPRRSAAEPRPGQRRRGFDLRRMFSLHAARGAGTAPRPDPRDARAARQRHPDVHHGLRHHPGRGEPDLRRAGSRPDHDQPRLHAQPRRLALFHRAGADHRLRRSGPAHAVGRAEPRDRDSARLRPRPGARAGRCRSAPGSTAPCRRAPRRSRGYVQGMHALWLAGKASQSAGRARPLRGLVDIETRYRYNPDVKSLVAMVPAMIPLLLMMIPAMLTALSVVREKELGSIVNLYVTPVDPPGIPARQADSLCRAGDAEFPAADAARGRPCSACR